MALQLGLSFGNGPFIIHKVRAFTEEFSITNPGSSSVTSLIPVR